MDLSTILSKTTKKNGNDFSFQVEKLNMEEQTPKSKNMSQHKVEEFEDYDKDCNKSIEYEDPSIYNEHSKSNDIEEDVKINIAKMFNRNRSELFSYTTFKSLGCDNMGKLLYDIECIYGISIPATSDKRIRTVGDIINIVKRKK